MARLGRVDPGLLKPILHRGEAAQRDRILLLARDGLVRSRTQLINQVRGFAKSLGQRLPSSSTRAFPRRVRQQFSEDFFPGQSVMLEMIDRLSEEIRRMDREAERLCKERYILGPFGPDTELRHFGLKLAERGGKAAKKRAAVAVARKLSVLLHRLWVTGEEYQAIGYGQPTQEAA